MPKSFFACLSAVLVLVMLAFAYGEADAARIGGGRSFGGRPSMSQPYTKPLPSNPSSSFSQQTNRQSQQAANAATATQPAQADANGAPQPLDEVKGEQGQDEMDKSFDEILRIFNKDKF